MIVYKNNQWAINSLYPDSKYDEKADYWIEDDSEIADFIINTNNHFKITSAEADGKILSVEYYYPIEEIIKQKCQEINDACSNIIYQGIDYNGEHYDLTDEDQINMLAWSSIAQLGNSVPYHSSGNPCRIYSAEEFLGLVNAATQFKTYNLSYCNLLKQQVSEMTDSEEVKNIKYGDNLNEKYQNILNQLLGGQNETNS